MTADTVREQLNGYAAARRSGAPISVINRYNDRLTALAEQMAEPERPGPAVSRPPVPAPPIDWDALAASQSHLTHQSDDGKPGGRGCICTVHDPSGFVLDYDCGRQ